MISALRVRIFSLAGGLDRTGRRTMLQLPDMPWATLLLDAIITLRALSAPG